MSLRGSLDTFALTDVLTLVANTAKTGELDVSGPSGEGRIWFARGQVVGAQSAVTDQPVDVLVGLLRLEEGDFTFHSDREPAESVSPRDVATLLEQAVSRLAEWEEVERVLPSAAAVVTLAPVAPGSVRLSRDQWATVAAIGAGTRVDALVEHLGGDELGRWRLVAGLVEAGLVEVGETGEAVVVVAPVGRTELAEQLSTLTVAAIAEDAEPAPRVEAPAVAFDDDDDEVDDVDDALDEDADDADDDVDAVEAPAAATAAGDPAEGVSRGTLLKFLSSVRS